MGIKLRKKGGWYGNKGVKHLPNLKVGEFRYYIQDNPNIIHGKSIRLQVAFFKDFFESLFPDYTVIIEKVHPNDSDYFFYEMEKVIEKKNPKNTIPPVDNKAYICFREARHGQAGLLFYWHDRNITIYQERFVRDKKKKIK